VRTSVSRSQFPISYSLMLRILVPGKTGQVGSELRHTLAPLGEVLALDRSQLDVSSKDSIRRAIR